MNVFINTFNISDITRGQNYKRTIQLWLGYEVIVMSIIVLP